MTRESTLKSAMCLAAGESRDPRREPSTSSAPPRGPPALEGVAVDVQMLDLENALLFFNKYT